MDVTVADIIAIAPEFKEFSETTEGEVQIETIIDVAETMVCESRWGEKKAKLAVQYLTAHILTDTGVGQEGGSSSNLSGPVTSERVGDLSRTYGTVNISNGSSSDALYLTTKYGRMFLMLKKSVSTTPMVT